jgi:hypothetical protein
MARGLQIRLACAAALLTSGMAALYVGGRLGVVHVNAGDMAIVFGPSDNGLSMGLASRGCPPDCTFDIDWRPMASLQATGL